jgi:uncharacterized protein YbcI
MLLTRGIGQVSKRYHQLKDRYGPRLTKAILIVVVPTFFLPIPGSTLVPLAIMLLIAEVYLCFCDPPFSPSGAGHEKESTATSGEKAKAGTHIPGPEVQKCSRPATQGQARQKTGPVRLGGQGSGGRPRSSGDSNHQGQTHMDQFRPFMAQQIAQAACDFEHQRTGHVPKSVTVVLSDDTLVITLRGALSPAEKALAQTPGGAAQVQEFHRQLFAMSSESLRVAIQRITGVAVREATAEIEMITGAVMQVFATGTVVQVFLLAHPVPGDTWSDSRLDGPC